MHVHANAAMTLDGAIGLPGPKPLRISSDEDMRRVHLLRAESDALLVGVGTVLADDPKLDVKWDLIGRERGQNPLRVVLDANARVPDDALVLDDRAPTLLIHGPNGPQGAGRVRVAEDRPGRLSLTATLEALDDHGVRRLMVEGGGHVLAAFLQEGLVDVFSVYIAPWPLGLKDAPRLTMSTQRLDARLSFDRAEPLGLGVVLWFRRRG